MSMSGDINIYNTPVVQPPNGTTSNFDREWSSVQIATISVFAITYSLATFSMIIRYITSAAVLRQLELDVVLITLSWGTALGYFISVCFCMKYGWGSHAWDITVAEISNYYNYLLPMTLTYMWSPTLTKMSILAVLHRIDPSPWFRIGVYLIAGMLGTYTVVFTILLSKPCNPVDTGNSTCLNNLAIAQVVLNIFTDISIIALPIPTLIKLHIPFRQKVAVGGILGLGSAVLIASIARAPYVKIMATDLDFSRRQAEAGVWSLVELNFGIVCNNLMRVKPFLRAYLPKILTMLGLGSKNTSNQQGSHSAGVRDWNNGRQGRSYPLRSLDEGYRIKYTTDPAIGEYLGEVSDKPGSRKNGSQDSILS